ncbi:MAG: ribonuclease R [Bacteroidales bacterium]|nr:ribonuclease R [Bacteroidales bacterium]
MATEKKPHAPKKKRTTRRELADIVSDIFRQSPDTVFNYRQLSKRTGVKDTPSREMLADSVRQMLEDDLLLEAPKGRFRLKHTASQSVITGKVDITSYGNGYIISDDTEDDVYVSQKNLRQALHGDTVRVQLYARKKGARAEGQVIEIVKRARENFVGTIVTSEAFAFMIPDTRTMHYDFFIPNDKLNGAKDGQKVVARIVEWSHRAKNPVAEVVQVLGYPGENETEMHAILAEYNLPHKFPDNVEQEAERLDDGITPAEIARRRDFRGVPTFTIDPTDAKDFDDALSIRPVADGLWEVGIHIADVTFYIKKGSRLDEEAIRRGTSVYLVDRVVPMLPERLSNGICSLRPDEDKLCFSAVFEMDNAAQIVKQWFGRTVIRSGHRFDYEEAQRVIDTGEGPFATEIQKLNELAQIIRKERFQHGSINFERPEPKFILDENGKPTGVYYKEYMPSNELIEEFMLTANKQVASFCAGLLKVESPERIGKGKAAVYRVHDAPNLEKLQQFSTFISKFGYHLPVGTKKNVMSALNRVVRESQGTATENLVGTLALRCMAKAVYSTENIGHYGLGFKYYTHFTSPIRRYPDMMVHRLLQYYLDGQGERPDVEKLSELCDQCSDCEKRAADAERSSIKYKQVEFLSDKIGQQFNGTISGVTEWGIYVELDDNKCEGMIHIRDLTDDIYYFDEENYRMAGKYTGRQFQLGDRIKIEVWKANLLKKQLDFHLADEAPAERPLGTGPEETEFYVARPLGPVNGGRSGNVSGRSGNTGGRAEKTNGRAGKASGRTDRSRNGQKPSRQKRKR